MAVMVVAGTVFACSSPQDDAGVSEPVSPTDETVTSVPPATIPSTTTVMSPLDSMDQARQILDDYAIPPGGPFPAGSIEYAEWEHHCLGGFGFAPQLISGDGNDPGTVTDVASGEEDIFNAALNACRDVVLESGDFFILGRTDADAWRVYTGYMRVHQCLVDHGYPVDDPPSEEAFVASWVDGGHRDDWHPYSATPAGGPLTVIPGGEPSETSRRQLEIQATCPADWTAVLADDYPGGLRLRRS